MSGELVREVLSLAPRDLTPAQLLVLVVIAERSQTRARVIGGRHIPARECFPERADMLRDCRMTEDNLSKTLQRLARGGLEVRVPLGTDKIGRPFYARSGHRTTYRLPNFSARADQGPASGDGSATSDRNEATPGRTNVRAEGGPRSGQSRTTVRPETGPGSGPKRNVTGTEPEREPDSDRWRDRGQRGALAAAIPADERLEVDVEALVDLVADRMHGFEGVEESTARGMLTSGSPVPLVVNTIGKGRRGGEVIEGELATVPLAVPSEAMRRMQEQAGV
ncbi:hypothetical protein [uncultured Brachybacterium sp.]|uniref:hypothetical protein n=1 Tax=uncultured Brachybacterium sp. TaxID=189680 RepID=UPI00260FEED4|nr:hypothetical protein [uncultured Brachybacterium sp.]